MLTIIYGDESNCVYNTNVYFKNTYEPESVSYTHLTLPTKLEV